MMTSVRWHVDGLIAGLYPNFEQAIERAVSHVVVDDHVKVGRLVRAPGQALCRAGWDDESFSGDPDPAGSLPTCPACLNMLPRIQGSAPTTPPAA